jgi:hypothetical protein
MIITKQQSKRLRYICGAVDYNQPCDRKYTGGPEGKIRQIGKFKYIEQGNELVYFEYDGDVAPLSNYEAEEFLSALADDSGFHLGGGIHVEDLPSEDTNDHNDIVDATAAAIEHQVHIDVQLKNEVHEVNVQVEVPPASDVWMDEDGNEPDNINQGIADTPELLTEEEKKAAEEEGNLPPVIDTSTEVPPVELTEHAFTKEDAEKSIEDVEGQPLTGAPTLPFASPDAFKGIKMADKPAPPAKTPKQMTPEELTEDVVREISMTAAAREAARLHQIEYYNMPDVPSENIIRANAKIPGFLDDYGKCLKKVGMARTLTEIAKALPGQIDWIFR